MEWNSVLGVMFIILGTHLFLHEIVLTVRGLINMFAPATISAITNAQNALGSATTIVQQIATQVQAVTTAAASTSVSTQAQALSTNVNTTLNALQALNTLIGSNGATQAGIQTQQNTVQTALNTLSTSSSTLFNAIASVPSLSAVLSADSTIPGLISSLSISWNTASALVTTSASIAGQQNSLQFSDILAILTGGLAFNEVQFDKYFKNIAINNSPTSQTAILIRWTGVVVFVIGFALANNLLSFGQIVL